MSDRKDHVDALAVTLLVTCCVFWGFQQILIKTTIAEVPPLWQAALRFAGATVLLWIWCAVRGIRLFERDGTLVSGLVSGTFFAIEFSCIYLAMRDTTASRVTVFLYTSPFIVAMLLPRVVPSERLRPLQWLGLVIAFAAVAGAFAEGFITHSETARQLRGDAIALLAGLSWGLTTLVIRSSRLGMASAEKMLFYQVAVTAVVAPFVSLALGETWSLSYSAQAWWSIGLQTAVGAFASYLAWMWLLRHYPATKISAFAFLTPVCALGFGVVLLGEPLTPQLLTAVAGVAVGIVLVNRKPAG